jgi:hypothetical protein
MSNYRGEGILVVSDIIKEYKVHKNWFEFRLFSNLCISRIHYLSTAVKSVV